MFYCTVDHGSCCLPRDSQRCSAEARCCRSPAPTTEPDGPARSTNGGRKHVEVATPKSGGILGAVYERLGE